METELIFNMNIGINALGNDQCPDQSDTTAERHNPLSKT